MIKDAMYIRIVEKDNGFREEMKLFIMMNSWLCYGGIWRCENKISLRTFPGASLVAQMVKNPSAMQETQVQSLGREDPLEKGMATFQYSCLDKPMDRGARWTSVHGFSRSQT